LRIVVFNPPYVRKFMLVFQKKMNSIARPLNTTVSCPNVTTEQMKTVIKWRTRIRMVITELKDGLLQLEEELKLLTTLLYKNHNRFRNDKGYKTLRMLEKSCLRLCDNDLTNSVTDFLSFIPDSSASNNLCLPTLSMCQYVLHNVHNSAQNLHRTEVLCRKSGLLNIQRLNLGHFWGVGAVHLAVIGRLWILSRNILVKYHHIYHNLHNICQYLPGSALNIVLPENLLHLIPEDIRSSLDKTEASKDVPDNVVTVEDFLDLGEPIKRKDIAPIVVDIPEKKPKIEVSKASDLKKDVLSSIHSLDDLKDFLQKETEVRKTAKKTAFTRKLSQDQWKKLKKEVTDNINPSLPNKSIKNCRKLIRNALKQ